MMNEFMGIKNVTDALPIYGKDGCVDGFDIIHLVQREGSYKGTVEMRTTKYVREFDPNSVEGHTICGNRTIYTRSSAKAKKAPRVKKQVIMNKSGLAAVSKILGK
jgi:hypothetical protein